MFDGKLLERFVQKYVITDTTYANNECYPTSPGGIYKDWRRITLRYTHTLWYAGLRVIFNGIPGAEVSNFGANWIRIPSIEK